MAEIAHVFKDGDHVTIKADATKPNGDPMPQAGKRGVIIETPKPGRHIVDVPGMVIVNLLAEQLEAPTAAGSVSEITDVVAKGETPLAPAPAGVTPTYGFDVLAHSAVVASLTNPRTWFEPLALSELAESIKAVGLAQPILVRKLPGSRLGETFTDRRKGDPLPTHEVVAGERRWRACGLAGVRSIPVLIRELTDEQVLDLQLVENMQRKDLHPLEEAHGYRRILDLPQHAAQSMEDRVAHLSQRIKKSPRYIYQTLQLLKLCDFAKQVFLDSSIKLEKTTALQIATIGNEQGQIEATRRIAGLGAKGMEVIEDPMSQRKAEEYVRNTFRLTLSKAPFPIKVEYAGIAACTGCAKMSANAAGLFEEGPKVPDTCLDRSCYGKKNGAYQAHLAEAAKAEGQRVITGKAAKKLTPWEQHPESISSDEYEALDERRYGLIDKHNGKTIEQILGKDAPAPVLIERPDGQGFIKALPKKDVEKILKDRGIIRASTSQVSDSQRKAEQKAKAEKASRWAVAEQLLAAVDEHDNQAELCSSLLLPMAMRLWQRLDHESSKRTRKLLQWDVSTPPNGHAGRVKFFTSLNATQFNRFVVAACVADELHYAAHWHPDTDDTDGIAALLKVDPKAIRANLETAAKAEEKAKADKGKKAPTKKPTARKAAAQAFMAPMYAGPELAAIVGSAPIARTEIVSKVWAYIKKHKLQDAADKRMVNADAKLQAVFGKRQVSMFEMANLIGKQVKDKPWSVVATAKGKSGDPAAQMITSVVTDAVLLSKLAKSKIQTRDDLADLTVDELVEITGQPVDEAKALIMKARENWFATDATAAPITTKPAAKKAAKAKPAEKQMDLAIPEPAKTLSPQNAWPFPIGKETLAQAQERATAASKALKAGAKA